MNDTQQRAKAMPGPVVARGVMDLSMVMDTDVLDTRNAKKEWDDMAAAETATSSGIAALSVGGLMALVAGVAGFAAFLATIVVMCMTRPRSSAEWAVGIISTVVSSLAGGAAVVVKYHLHQGLPQDDMSLFMALVALGGLIFTCGLPGWAIVRWTFNWIEKRKGSTLPEVAQEARGVLPL